MSCSLVDLSPELQLKIINELLNDAIIEKFEDVKEEKEDDPYDYNQEKPDDFKDRKEWERTQDRVHDLKNWSSTSRFFRDLLTPYIFKTVQLSNNEKSGSRASSLSRSDLSKFVKEIQYTGSALGDGHKEEEAYSDTEAILPKRVDVILSDLKCFPNLETLSIHFPYKFCDYDEWDGGLDLCAEEETDEETKSAEEKIAWRALMSKTYEALSRNKNHSLKSLKLKQFGPIKVSTFSDSSFHDFLSSIEDFTLSIYGEDNGAGWQINKVPAYLATMSKLDIYFFNHLTSLTSLTLKAPEEGPLGLEGMNHIPLPLKSHQMPCLKTLFLEYIFIGPDLIDFLTAHTKSLETLTMRKCAASPDGLAENGIHWSKFFYTLANANFEKLTELIIEPGPVPLTSEETYNKEEDQEKVSGEVKEARRILGEDCGRRIFPYVMLDDKYGMLYENEEENLEAFRRGEDQAGWERLMGKVNEIAAKKSGR